MISLTCKSPFAGENDRATLLNIQNGIVSWNSSDWDHVSKEAKDFIEKILQPAPGQQSLKSLVLSELGGFLADVFMTQLGNIISARRE
ncbi:Obscurin, partial [Ophiophagus hannah]